MDENRMRFGVGVLVIAAIGIGIILTFLFGAFPTVLNREYTLDVWFPSSEGVSTNTPVLRDGFRIGRVSNIRLVDDFDEHPEGGVILTLRLGQEFVLTHEYVPRIGNGSFITGDSKLEFVRASRTELATLLDGNLDLIDEPYSDGEYFKHGRKAADPFSVLFDLEDDIRLTMESIRGAGVSVEQAGRSVQSMVGDLRSVIGMAPAPPAGRGAVSDDPSVRTAGYQNPPSMKLAQNTPPSFAQPQPPGQTISPRNDATLRDLADEAIRTLEEFQGAIRDVRQIVSNPNIRQNIETSIEKVPGFIDQATETLQSASDSFDSFERAGRQFEQVGSTADQTLQNVDTAVEDAVVKLNATLGGLEKTIANVERFTEPLGARGGELIEQVLTSLANLDNAVIELQSVGQMINRSDGTLRRLIEDDEMYYDVLRTVKNIENATARIRPILDDVRVFTDKVARDPRQLGVRGALTNRPNGLGLK
ncbi:MlaD family protein [Crateriforma conspicua]|uniref:Mce/MlaD domain-containing protein n=1 Tax=Crateriforma conspicua TaxID=2527996 RepID=A0A5C5Y5R5_9PLAN|nr:MlaD family protein [Crateriforma conspicua]QDV65067.1 hypothetical protein Mal65_42360 [Crateriforma conspicua]TWT70464.1 hypothetical protein Pan14r_27700 [Crateriforma conspicua]